MRGTVVVLCVSVTTPAATCIPDANKVPLGFLRHFQGMNCVDFVVSASFNSSGDICWPLWPSLLLDELSINESDGFISIIVVCISSDSSTEGYQLSWLRLLALFCTRSADLACMQYYYVIPYNLYNKLSVHSCGNVTLPLQKQKCTVLLGLACKFATYWLAIAIAPKGFALYCFIMYIHVCST